MTTTRFLSRACSVLGCLCSLLVGACTSGPSPTHVKAVQGPFEIATESSRVSAPGPDMHPFRTRLVYTFKLRHLGQTLAFSEAPSPANDKPNPPDTVLEKAYFLPGSNAVLVATNGSSFIVTQAQGQALVTRVAPQEFAAYQSLDSEAGHPGPKRYNPSNATPESRTLAGGKQLLLFNNGANKLGVLDVASLSFHGLEGTVTSQHNGMDHYSGDFRDDGGPNGRARAVSPSGTQFVQVAVKYVDGKPLNAFVVIDFARKRHAIVPLDVDATRLNSFRKMTPEWLARYYEWTTGQDGVERFAAKRLSAAQPWTGYFTDRRVESAQYRLQPVSADMLGYFIGQLETSYGAVRQPPKPGQLSVTVQIGAESLDLSYYADSQMLTVSPMLGVYTESAIAACEKIATEFDRQLAGGAHQALFTHLASRDIWAEY